jgi:hypothetical protein
LSENRFLCFEVFVFFSIAVDRSPAIPPRTGRARHLGWGMDHEAKSIHGRADHRDFARAGSWDKDTSAASTESAARLSTNGKPNTAAWKSPTPDG